MVFKNFGLIYSEINNNPKVIKKWAKQEKVFEKLQDDEQFKKIVK